MAAHQVKVYTVGIGTKEGETISFEGWSMRVRLDEETLKQVAAITRAEYFYAGTAQDLKKVYQSLGSRLSAQKKETEVSALFAGLGAVLALLAAGLSLAWFHRVLRASLGVCAQAEPSRLRGVKRRAASLA
jgi:Ca-activated chloride channel family protein